MMKKYLKNPYVWSMLPIVCALSYNLAPDVLLVTYGFIFPIIWIAAGYQVYRAEENVKKTLLKLHIPILICLVLTIIQTVGFDVTAGFSESANNEIRIYGPIAQRAIFPMAFIAAFFDSVIPDLQNQALHISMAFTLEIMLMFILSYFGTRMKAWGQS